MFEKTIQTIPPDEGSYALWLYLPKNQDLVIGQLGSFAFPAGNYIYFGSAKGPGGLRARLGRHVRGDGKTRWHIDYLRAAAQVYGFGFKIQRGSEVSVASTTPAECSWSQNLATVAGARIVVRKFGASDCRSGCAAHLIHFTSLDRQQISALLNCEIRILSGIQRHPAV